MRGWWARRDRSPMARSMAGLFVRACFMALCLGGAAGRAAELVRGPTVEFTEGTHAVVRWKTDVSTGSRVYFGETQEGMTRRADGSQGIEHEVTLPPLGVGTKWYYTVSTARVPLATNSFVVPDKRTRSLEQKEGAPPKTERAPPAAKTWGHLASLEDHFRRHGGDFEARNADDYARMAWEFRQRAKVEGLPTKVDSDGVMRIYDPKSGAFAAYNKDGTTKTFFKPNSPGYFDRQPGDLVKGKQ